MSRLEEILERNKRATPGPWWGQFLNPERAVIWKLGEEGAGAICRLDRESKYDRHRDNTSADVDFIAGARTDIPLLLERIEHLQRENERLQFENSRLRVEGDPSISNAERRAELDRLDWLANREHHQTHESFGDPPWGTQSYHR